MHPFLFLLAAGCLGNSVISEPGDLDGEQAEHFPTLTADPVNSDYDDPSVEVICNLFQGTTIDAHPTDAR